MLNAYLFTGRRVDILDSGSLKTQYNRNRYYDYYTGRWVTQDPLGITPNMVLWNSFSPGTQLKDGLNIYEYVKSRPLRYLDSSGFAATTDSGELDLDLLWGYIELFSGGSGCGITSVDLKDLTLHDAWTTGFCPPGTGLIAGWPVARPF
jgi:RHS repeat-associated protein